VRGGLRDVISRRDWRGAQVIGSGGTFTNLASIHLARHGMLAARNVHETPVPRVDVEHILDTLAAMTTAERRDVPGLNPERADIIVAGLAVAAEVLARLESRDLTVSRYGIREGLLLELARVTPTSRTRRGLASVRYVSSPSAATTRRGMRRRCAGSRCVSSTRSARDSAAGRRNGRRSPMPRCSTTSAITSTTTVTTSTPTI
jgi:exopolyphosphatase/pppGpp-phosphohydrolase